LKLKEKLIVKANYFVFGTNNMQKAVEFYDAVFECCDIKRMPSEGRMTLWAGDEFMFAVAEPFNGEAATFGNGTMIGLNVGSSTEVERLYARTLALGASDEGECKIRSGRFSAYVRDLDGNKICFYE